MKCKDTVNKVKVLEEEVKENSSVLMQPADAIKASTESTQRMEEKMEGVSQAVRAQGKKAMDQFETLKMLIEIQRKTQGNQANTRTTYAERVAIGAQQGQRQHIDNKDVPGAAQDQRPPPPSSAEPTERPAQDHAASTWHRRPKTYRPPSGRTSAIVLHKRDGGQHSRDENAIA